MSPKGRSSSGRAALAAVLTFAASSVQTDPRSLALTGWDARAVETAKAGAVRKLQDPECQRVLTDFTDAEGRTLRQNLDQWNMSPADYLGLVPFLDGSQHPLCRKTKVAFVASPGVRRVYVCKTFADVQLRQPDVAESMVIHEILHTLGLGENPPSSQEITHRVERRCR